MLKLDVNSSTMTKCSVVYPNQEIRDRALRKQSNKEVNEDDSSQPSSYQSLDRNSTFS